MPKLIGMDDFPRVPWIAEALDRRRPRRVEQEVNGMAPALADTWFWRDRWREVLVGAWELPGLIHCLESRTSFCSLRRAALDSKQNGCEILTMGDNMPEICAAQRGRDVDEQLNALGRRAAGYQLGGDILWRRRHVDTKRNSADRGSRVADKGLLQPGEVVKVGGALQARARAKADACARRPQRAAAAVRSAILPATAPGGLGGVSSLSCSRVARFLPQRGQSVDSGLDQPSKKTTTYV